MYFIPNIIDLFCEVGRHQQALQFKYLGQNSMLPNLSYIFPVQARYPFRLEHYLSTVATVTREEEAKKEKLTSQLSQGVEKDNRSFMSETTRGPTKNRRKTAVIPPFYTLHGMA